VEANELLSKCMFFLEYCRCILCIWGLREVFKYLFGAKLGGREGLAVEIIFASFDY